MFRFSVDHDAQILHSTLEGFWSVKIVEAYLDELERQCIRARRAFGRLLILIDCTGYAVQSQEVQARTEVRNDILIHGPDDRAAIILASSLQKQQAKRILTSRQTEVFLSAHAAQTWLRAWLLAGV